MGLVDGIEGWVGRRAYLFADGLALSMRQSVKPVTGNIQVLSTVSINRYFHVKMI